MSDTVSAWAVATSDDGSPVVYPMNDLRPHDLNDGACECWCRPFWDDNVRVHNSMDQRETYERGRKLQ